jgi:signal transduction histidine kinase/CHASE1-domain containing sensor protein/ActR/RegA family two-component response regulator
VRKSIAPWAGLAGSLALTLAATAVLYNTARVRDYARVASAMRTTRERLEARLETLATALGGAAALLAAQPQTSAAEFQAYVDRLDLARRHPGIQGIAYARRVHRAQSPDVEAEFQSRGFAGLRIWPDAGREERSVVFWIEPLDQRNRAAVGFDMYTEPTRREALERARDTGRASLSGKVTLAQEIDERRQAGFLLYVPVYSGGRVPETIPKRREALLGWTAAAVRADDFIDAIFGHEVEPAIDFQIYDGPALPARLLRDRPQASSLPGRLVETQQMSFGGREWTLVFNTLPALLRGSLAPAWVVLLSGLFVSLLVFFYSQRETRARSRTEAALAELQRSLEERSRFEQRLHEEGRINSILRRLGISLAAELDPDRLAQLVADEAAAITGAQMGAIFDAGPRHRLLAVAVAQDGEAPVLELSLSQGLAARVFGRQETVRIEELKGEEPVFRQGPGGLQSLLAVPIVSRTGEALAGLFFGHAEPGHFTEHHERLLQGLAGQASIALDNARLLRDLQETDRRKDEFLAVLGHELRNPLAPVVTALEVIRRDRSSADRQFAIIERQTRHMVRIVDDLLDVSRISKGKIELKKQTLSVRDALDRAAEAVSPLARARDQKLTVSHPPEPLVVVADPVRLEQILGNLLSNAIKYTPAGGAVELSARERDGQLEIQVRDNGIGIPHESLKTLFDPFMQVVDAKDYATGGLGIGLALVRGLVALHGGSVRSESEGRGRGSTFTVLLPDAVEGATPVELRSIAPRAKTGRVLVVDDNQDAALTLSEAVRMDGHDVRVAHDGPAALEEARGFAPEVVLLDIGLPGMDGYEVVGKLRQMPHLGRTLMVALTGFGQESDRQRALQAGFDEHLVKPVDLDTIHGVLRRRLGNA